MIRAVIDARMIRRSGIGVYLRGLLDGFGQLPQPPELTLLGDPSALAEYAERPGWEVAPFTARIYGMGEQLAFPYGRTRGQVLHAPHYNAPLLRRRRLVVTVHDLIHWRWPEHLPGRLAAGYARFLLRAVRRHAACVIANSAATRQDLIELLGVAPERIRVIPLALSSTFRPTADEERLAEFARRLNLPGEYLLAVGIDKPHKNFARLVRALAPIWRDRRLDLPLLIAGIGKPGSSMLPRLAAELGVVKKVRLVEFLPDAELPMLYQLARAFVIPSRCEGFGLPVLEAQAAGAPVAASNAFALPETAGAGAAFFDPEDEEEMRRRIREVVEDAPLRARLIAAGKENVKRFSWKETAAQTLEVYKSC